MLNFFDPEWYPMVLVGRTGSEIPKVTIKADSKITKIVKGDSKITKSIQAQSTVVS